MVVDVFDGFRRDVPRKGSSSSCKTRAPERTKILRVDYWVGYTLDTPCTVWRFLDHVRAACISLFRSIHSRASGFAFSHCP
jgi:hypothetical protein